MNRYDDVRMKGSNHFSIICDNQFFIPQKQNLWCNKLWLRYNIKTKNIHIHEEATKQEFILPFPYFDILGIKWNQHQSSFIAFGEAGQNCVINRHH